MGNIPIYNAQLSAITGIPQPTASPDDMGAGIGRALQGLGQQVTGLGADIRDHQARKAGIEGQLALAQARMDMTDSLVQLETSDAAGDPEFANNYIKQFDDYETKALDALPNNPKVRDAFRVGMANLRATLGSRAMLTEATLAAAKTAGDAKNALSIGINTVAIDPTQYDEVVANGQKLIAELNLPPTDREATEREFVDAVTSARFNSLFAAAKTPDAIAGVISDLKTGDWKGVMGAKQFEETLRLAESAQNSIQTVMREQATIAVGAMEDRIKGGVVLDAMELAEVGAQVKLAADPSLTDKWVRLRVQYDTSQKVKGLSTPDLRGYVDGNLNPRPGDASSLPAGDTSLVVEATSGKIRNKPIAPQLRNVLAGAAHAAGVKVVVTSGGQPPAGRGGSRTGSTRHDHGNAADLQLVDQTGRVLDFTNAEDRKVFEAFVAEASARGATGIGAGVTYMGSKTIHVGFGSKAAWGAGGKGANAPQWLVSAVAGGRGRGMKVSVPANYQPFYEQAAATHGVPVDLLIAQGAHESANFDPDVVSGKRLSSAGAAGIAQFMPDTAKRFGINPLDPAQAIDGQARYMKFLLDRYDGNKELALAAYNWGEGNIDNVGSDKSRWPAETREYVSRIMSGGSVGVSDYQYVRGTAAQGVLDAREKLIKAGNMVTAGEQSGLYTLEQLTEPNDFANRARQSALAASFLETENQPFTPDELEGFNKVMSEGTVEEKLALLESVNAMGTVSEAAFDQIGEKTPLLGYIGGLAVEAPGISREILRGQQRLQDNPDLKEVLATGENGGTIRHFATVTSGALDALPDVAYSARLAADALYVQRMGGAATGAFDVDVYNQAVRDVLGGKGEDGGVTVINDKAVVLPPGVSGDEFETMVEKLTPRDLIAFSVGGGPPTFADGTLARPEEIASEGQFTAIAAGSYTITMADGKPLGGTGPNGFYVLQIEARDVADVIARPDIDPADAELPEPPALPPTGAPTDTGENLSIEDSAFNTLMENPNVSPDAKVIWRRQFKEFKQGKRKSWTELDPKDWAEQVYGK